MAPWTVYLYPDGKQANPRINLLSDSSYYFLTWYTDNRTGLREVPVIR